MIFVIQASKTPMLRVSPWLLDSLERMMSHLAKKTGVALIMVWGKNAIHNTF